MKKIILSAVVAAAAVFGAYTANQTSNEVAMNDLQVENVEALGDGEDPCNITVEEKYPGKPENGTKYVCFGKGSIPCC